VDYLQYGGTGQPPFVPPRRYWGVHYRTPDGYRAVEDWYAGFRSGAASAQATGYRHFVTVPSAVSVTGGVAPLHVPVPAPGPVVPTPESLPVLPAPTPVQVLPAVPPEAGNSSNGQPSISSAAAIQPEPTLPESPERAPDEKPVPTQAQRSVPEVEPQVLPFARMSIPWSTSRIAWLGPPQVCNPAAPEAYREAIVIENFGLGSPRHREQPTSPQVLDFRTLAEKRTPKIIDTSLARD
jgi:hypothetical protein